MSSSAFTPTTTTVTNEVPVNVPVVEVFRQYSAVAGTDITAITTNPTFGVVTLNNVNIFRSGEEARFYFTFSQSSGGSAGSGTYRFRMPSGITIDTSKTGTNTSADFFGKSVVGRAYASLPSGSEVDTQLFVVNSTTIECRSFGSNTVANFGGALRCTFEFNVPIAEWAGSGTTTLATRAVEEYLSTTSFSSLNVNRGPNGAAFPTTTPAGTFESISFGPNPWQTTWLPTDIVSIEVDPFGNNKWTSIAGSIDVVSLTLQETSQTYIGLGFYFDGTNWVLIRGKYRNPNASNGLWSGMGAGIRYRIKKVSSGAQVGYPVSARNIIGDTSGSVVPVGMIGQIITASGARTFGSISGNTWWVGTLSSGSGITLTPGVWLVGYSFESTWIGGTNAVTTAVLTTDTADGFPSNNTSASLTGTAAFLGNIEGFTQTSTVPVKKEASGYLNVTSNTTYTIKVNANVTTFTGSYTCRFYAVRIA